MKIVAYTPLLYGAEWLQWAIRSVIDVVDEYHVLYTVRGNHHGDKAVDLPPGEDAVSLYEIAREAAGRKLRWYTHVGWNSEGEQRDTIYQLALDADRILVLDYDEIWSPGLAQAVIAASFERPDVREWRVPMIHLWRDLHHAILRDPAFPTRLINPHAAPGTSDTFDVAAHDAAKHELLNRTLDYVPEFHSRIVHAGYAISPALMRAKWTTHGHLNELRTDIDWFAERYENPAAMRDLHPVGSDYWNAEPIDPFVYLPPELVDHPLFAQGVAA